MSTPTPSGQRISPPDVETAEQSLVRQFLFHKENAQAVWLPFEHQAREADAAVVAFVALESFYHEQENH